MPATLKDLQRYVGGLVQEVYLHSSDPTVIMLVNEEGKFSQEPLLNNIASMLFEMRYGFGLDYIVGDVVVLGSKGDNFGDLPAEGFALITRATEECQRRARL